MRANTFLFTIALFGMLASGLAAPVSAQTAIQVPAAHVDAIEASEGEVYGNWQRGLETVTFFLDHDEPLQETELPDGSTIYTADDSKAGLGYFHYEPPFASIPVESMTEEDLFLEPFHPNDKRATILRTQSAFITDGEVDLDVTPLFSIPTSADALPFDLNPKQPYRVYGFEATLYVGCQSNAITLTDPRVGDNTVGLGIGANLRFQKVNADGSIGSYQDFGSGGDIDHFLADAGTLSSGYVPGSDTLLPIYVPVLTPPPSLEQIFRVEVSMNPIGNFDTEASQRGFLVDPSKLIPQFDVGFSDEVAAGACTLHYGSEQFPSNFRLVTDTLKHNTWIEDKDDDFAIGFPSAADTSQEQRRMQAVIAESSAWPGFNAFKHRATEDVNYQDRLWDNKLFDSPYFDDLDENTGNDRLFMRWRALDDNSIVYDSRTGDNDQLNLPIKPVPGSRTAQTLGDGLNLIKEDYLYTTDLPDGAYQFEVYSNRHLYATSTSATVGLKGFSFDLFESPGETDLRHQVERGESTVYRLLLRNLGASDDTITLRAQGGSTGWTVSMPQTRVALPATNAASTSLGQEVLLTVTPGPNVQVGAETTVTVTATSSFPQEVAPQELKLTTTIVAEEPPAVDLFGDTELVQVRPGDKLILQNLFVHNQGSSADTYIVEAKLPGGIGVGWTSRALPPGKLVEADSIEDFAIEINVASDAKPGQRITLPVTARLVGASATTPVTDTIEIPIEVILEHVGQFYAVNPVQSIRDPNVVCSDPYDLILFEFSDNFLLCSNRIVDARYSDTTLFKLRLTNDGPVDERYTLRGTWVMNAVNGIASTDDSDSSPCDGANTGPDGWRLDYGVANDPKINGDAVTRYSRSPQVLETVVVPAGQTLERWVEMGLTNDDLGNNCGDGIPQSTFSQAAQFRIVATPESEPGNKETVFLGAYRVDPAGDINGVDLSPAFDLAKSLPHPTLKESQLVDQSFQEVRHRFTVRNDGNERDDISVSTDAGGSGWTQSIDFVETAGPNPGYSCTSFDGAALSTRWSCNMMANHGEATFELVIRPGSSASVGQTFNHVVTAVSQQNGFRTDALTFQTNLVGAYLFSSATTVGSRSAEPGQEVTLPFYIDNQGTRDDTYSVSLLSGNREYKPRFSIDDQVFVPGAHRLDAYLRVQVPDGASVGDSEVFTALVSSSDPGLGPVTLTFRVTVVADSGILVRAADGSNSVLIRERGTPQNIDVEAILASGTNGDPITFRVDRAKLPAGWTVADPLVPNSLAPHQAGFSSVATFAITAPANAIGTSTVPLIVDVCLKVEDECTTNADFVASGDIILNLQDDVGISLRLDDPDVATATLPGGDVVYPVRVENRGLSSDLVELSNTEVQKPGWTISYDPPLLSLAPLESRVVDVIVSTPTTAAPGEKVDFLLFATSGVDPSAFDQLALSAEIGVFDLEVKEGTPAAFLAPGETRTFVTTVYNNGTLPEVVFGAAALNGTEAQKAYGGIVSMSMDPVSFELQPGRSKDVAITVKVGPSIPAKVTVPVKATFSSVPNPDGSPVAHFDVKVLDYRARDVDGDGIVEYAVDRDRKTSNGFEEFREASGSAGKQTQPAHLVRFLNAEGLARHSTKVTVNGTVLTVTNLIIDGDVTASGKFGDGRVDLFLDDTGDGLPDLYWDPDDRHSHRIQIFKDIDADGVPDYFVDTDGNGAPDAVYNLAQGTFVGLLARDVDNDGVLDFVVDKNGNGLVDKDETVLFTKNGKLVQVTKVDVDGDGRLDDVFDMDGDGVPDYYIPAGKTKGVPIRVDRDVNGDGFLDWTYDANRDGKDDHYYDPAAQTGGNEIDTTAEFVRSIQQYWYIGALFVLVAALFVVLVAVTRR